MSLFDGTNVDENEAGRFETLPDGEYMATVTGLELKQSEKNSACKYFNTTFEIVKGPYAGRKVWGTFVTEHQNEKPRNIGRAYMKKIALATTGTPVITHEAQVYGKPLIIKIVTKKSKETGDYLTNVTEIKPLTATPTSTSTPTKPVSTPVEAIPF